MSSESAQEAPPLMGRVSAILTAYRPSEALRDVVASALEQCRSVIVVDNTPHGFESATGILLGITGVSVVSSGGNVGLAAALNRGIAASGDSEYLLLLDQDSTLPDHMVDLLAALLEEDGNRAVAAPAPWHTENGRYLDPRTPRRAEVAQMTAVITSGMLLRRSAFEQTRGMREDFFVDCVDQDLCLQLVCLGWSTVQEKRLLLPHSLGESAWHRIGPISIRATHHPTWRLYWIARNGVILSREYFRRRPGWSLTCLLILVYWMLTILLFEPPRFRRLRTMFTGVADGLSRRRRESFLPEALR